MATINVLNYGAVSDANYYNEGDGQYYKDPTYTILPTDNTGAFREALLNASGHTLEVPAGRFMILGTLWVESNTIIQGAGMGLTNIYVGNGNILDSVLFRVTNVKPIIITRAGSGQITFKDFTLHGNKNLVDYAEWGVAGILAKETEQIKFINVDVSWINMRGSLQSSHQGWSMTSMDCNDIEFYKCRSEYGGYQNFGFFDRTTNGLMHECFSGMGRRTSTQVHRDCSDIQILRNTIIQPDNVFLEEAHAALTIHGEPGEEVRNLLVDDNTIEMSHGFKAAVQAFRASQGLIVTNNRIKSNAEGVHLGDADGARVESNQITYIPSNETLHTGKIGVNVVNGTRNSFVRYNEINGFDLETFRDSTVTNVIISDNHLPIVEIPDPTHGSTLWYAKIYKNENGKIVEVKPFAKVDGLNRLGKSIIIH